MIKLFTKRIGHILSYSLFVANFSYCNIATSKVRIDNLMKYLVFKLVLCATAKLQLIRVPWVHIVQYLVFRQSGQSRLVTEIS